MPLFMLDSKHLASLRSSIKVIEMLRDCQQRIEFHGLIYNNLSLFYVLAKKVYYLSKSRRKNIDPQPWGILYSFMRQC